MGIETKLHSIARLTGKDALVLMFLSAFSFGASDIAGLSNLNEILCFAMGELRGFSIPVKIPVFMFHYC